MSKRERMAVGAQSAGSNEEARHLERLVLRSGEQCLYAGAHVASNVRPAITVGALKDGRPVIHFRNYKSSGPDAWCISKEGATFTLDEVAIAIRRLCALFPYVPELLAAMREMSGIRPDE